MTASYVRTTALGYYLERAAAIGIDDEVLADPQVFLAHADVTPVAPGCATLWRWLELV
jgi:hypothetical protein